MSFPARAKRRSPEEMFAAAVEKTERARVRRASHLSIGEQRRSLTDIPPLSGLSYLRDLTLKFTGITDLSPLNDVKWIEFLDLSGCPVWDLGPLRELKQLKGLSVRSTNVRDISPLYELPNLVNLNVSGTKIDKISFPRNAQLKNLYAFGTGIKKVSIEGLLRLDLGNTPVDDLGFLDNLPNLNHLSLISTQIKDYRHIENCKKLEVLDINHCEISDISFLSKISSLRSLSIVATRVKDLSPVANIRELEFLNVSRTRISDLSPLTYNTSLPSVFSASHRLYNRGIICYGCEFSDPDINKASRLDYVGDRTLAIFEVLRRNAGLPSLNIAPAQVESKGIEDVVQPIEKIPSTFAFGNTSSGQVIIESNPVDFPIFPGKRNEVDHVERLEVCASLIEDLINELEDNSFQVRINYLSSLKKYASRMPTETKRGNILLADAEARIIRNLFAADTDILPAPFAARLKTLLEYHIGLRVFYPEISRFYKDVQTGKLISPLPLDAVEGFVRVVEENVPNIFDGKVQDVLEGTTAGSDDLIEENLRDYSPRIDEVDPRIIQPPNDPLGDIDAHKSWDFTVAGVTNGLWKAFLEGERINKTVGSWSSAGQALRPYAKSIIDWLKEFTGA